MLGKCEYRESDGTVHVLSLPGQRGRDPALEYRAVNVRCTEPDLREHVLTGSVSECRVYTDLTGDDGSEEGNPGVRVNLKAHLNEPREDSTTEVPSLYLDVRDLWSSSMRGTFILAVNEMTDLVARLLRATTGPLDICVHDSFVRSDEPLIGLRIGGLERVPLAAHLLATLGQYYDHERIAYPPEYKALAEALGRRLV